MGKVKGHGHIVDLVSNWCTSFWFHINGANFINIWPIECLTLKKKKKKKTSEILENKFAKKKFPTEFLQNRIRWLAWPGRYC